MNDTISEQTGELLKLRLSILSRTVFQKTFRKKKKQTSKFSETQILKQQLQQKDARRQSCYSIEISIGQSNVKTQKLFIIFSHLFFP